MINTCANVGLTAPQSGANVANITARFSVEILLRDLEKVEKRDVSQAWTILEETGFCRAMNVK